MSRYTHLSLLIIAAALHRARAQTATLEPLASKLFPSYPSGIPYQVTGDQGGIRGPQWGYNLCNSTTQNQQSLCQTLLMNSISDFCIWSSSETNDTIGESEAREVAWCSLPIHGTRTIPLGAITGLQWLYAKDYIQLVGFLDQTQVGLNAQDEGGELDPHGADEQGNPLGGIVFTNAYGVDANEFDTQFKAGQNGSSTYTQVVEWVDFIGGGMFCLKMCNPAGPDAATLCQHVYDEIGCAYNALANYGAINGTFQVCDSDDMAPPGIFTDSTGQLTTWFQPFSGTFSVPYTTTIPASSNCHTYESTDLFAEASSFFPSSSTAVATATGSAGSATAKVTGSSSRSGSVPSATGSTSGAAGTPSALLAVGLLTTFSTMVATMFSML